MTLHELARRLENASDDLARMRSELSAEGPLRSPGPGPAYELIATLNSAWSKRQQDLVSLISNITELADGVRLAAERYTATDGSQQWTR